MIAKEILLFLRIQIPCIRYFAKHQKIYQMNIYLQSKNYIVNIAQVII